MINIYKVENKKYNNRFMNMYFGIDKTRRNKDIKRRERDQKWNEELFKCYSFPGRKIKPICMPRSKKRVEILPLRFSNSPIDGRNRPIHEL